MAARGSFLIRPSKHRKDVGRQFKIHLAINQYTRSCLVGVTVASAARRGVLWVWIWGLCTVFYFSARSTPVPRHLRAYETVADPQLLFSLWFLKENKRLSSGTSKRHPKGTHSHFNSNVVAEWVAPNFGITVTIVQNRVILEWVVLK